MIRQIIICAVILLSLNSFAQKYTVSDPYLKINAKGNDPVYTTYTAAMERSRLYGDKGYKMDYYSDSEPLNYASDKAGRMFNVWKIDKVVINRIGEYYKKPVIKASFSDMVIIEYEPFEDISVQEVFMVYSSRFALVDMYIKNNSNKDHLVEIYPVIEFGNDSLIINNYDNESGAFYLEHKESLSRLISGMYKGFGYPTDCSEVFTTNFDVHSWGAYDGDMDDFYNYMKTDFYAANYKNDSLNLVSNGNVDFVSLHGQFQLSPGDSENLRYIRGIQKNEEEKNVFYKKANKLKEIDIQQYINKNVELFSSVPKIQFKTEDEKLVYLSALNLARGCMYPPSGETSHNFYVFSREPLWGWGHGHQVLHESLSMMAYVYLDAESAQGSQRVYMEQQADDGLIAYRHGPRGAQTYPHKGRPTTSAPFYSWINLEVYKVSKDKQFLIDAYVSGVKYVNWLEKERDLDGDGTFEWGPYGIIENVRDWYNAVFQVSPDRYLDVDKEDISDELECLDLTVMVIKEMRSLSEMAEMLGKPKEAKKWKKKADKISELVNELMWDEESEFYYSVNKKDHSFKFMTRDLRREEIIGFLPLWAEAVPKERADKLVKKLTDPDKFWRKYGVPTLAADDEWYSPYVDYCCKWNGPVWLLWDYMVFHGLKNYGYDDIANELADKMMLAVTTQLSVNHNFWESFSPDYKVLNSPSNYIWDAIMAKLLIERYMR